MTDSSPLVAIVVGVGLAVLTSRDIIARRDDGQTHEHTPFFVLAVQLVGFVIVAAALYVAAHSFENGHKLGAKDLKAENLFIATLVALVVFLGIRNAWNSVAHPPATSPWEWGLFDHLQPLIVFVVALPVAGLVTLLIDEALIAESTKAGGVTRLLTGIAIVTAGVSLVTLILRLIIGRQSSPTAFARSRHQQRQLLDHLAASDGYWQSVSVTAAGVLEPALSMSATIWVTTYGWYWLSEDGGMLARYHNWAAHHARLPTPKLHTQAVTVWAGRMLHSRRGLRITPITTHWWWIDAWRSHRDQPAPAPDKSRPEYEAGLVFISPGELQAAGLTVLIEAQAKTCRDNSAKP
jgi:hypothetical protein